MRLAALAFLLAAACSGQVDERCPGTALDSPPRLIGKWDALIDAARRQGVEGRLQFQLTVTDTGSPRDPIVRYPEKLAGSDRIKGEILKLRFCPAVKYSRYAEVQLEFDIQVK